MIYHHESTVHCVMSSITKLCYGKKNWYFIFYVEVDDEQDDDDDLDIDNFIEENLFLQLC